MSAKGHKPTLDQTSGRLSGALNPICPDSVSDRDKGQRTEAMVTGEFIVANHQRLNVAFYIWAVSEVAARQMNYV